MNLQSSPKGESLQRLPSFSRAPGHRYCSLFLWNILVLCNSDFFKMISWEIGHPSGDIASRFSSPVPVPFTMPKPSNRSKAGKKNRKKRKDKKGGRNPRPYESEESETPSSESEDDGDVDSDDEMELRPRPLEPPHLWEPDQIQNLVSSC